MPALAYGATARAPPPVVVERPRWTVERVAAEHEARGLLNFLMLVTRCIESGLGDTHEGQQWAREKVDAQDQLERLYAAGLPRDFLRAPPSLASEPPPHRRQ